MKKTIACALAALTLAAAGAHADPVSLVSRQSADTYVDHGSGVTLSTVGCTQTAVLMDARLVRDDRTHRLWVVFYDLRGEEEGDCEVASLVSAPRFVKAGAHGRVRVAAK